MRKGDYYGRIVDGCDHERWKTEYDGRSCSSEMERRSDHSREILLQYGEITNPFLFVTLYQNQINAQM